MALSELAQTDQAAGMFRGVARHLIPPNGLYDLLNGLTDEDGNVYKRGGSEYHSTSAFGSTGLRFLFDGYFVPGRRTVFAKSDDFGVLAADDVTPVNVGGPGLTLPVKPAMLKGLMFIPGGTVYGGSRMTADYSTGTITVTNGSAVVTGSGTTWNTLVDAGMLLRVAGAGPYYVVKSVDSVTQVTLARPYEGTTGGGKAYVLSPVGTAAAGGYQVADIYATAGGRMLACVDDRVYMSAWNNPHSWAATDYHQLPGGTKCLGAVGLRDSALIFTTTGLWVIENLQFELTSDFADPQQRLDQVNTDLVLWGQAGIAPFADAQVIPAIDGVWIAAPGAAPVLLSRSIQALYADYVKGSYVPGGAFTYKNHYFLPILDAGGAPVDCLVCRLDRPIETDFGVVYPWSRLTGHGASVTAFAVRPPAGSGRPKLLAASIAATSRVLDVSGFFEPTAANAAEADGTVHPFQEVTRDFPTGALNENLVRRLRGRYELSAANGSVPVLSAYFSDGRDASSASLWGTMLWGTGLWGSQEDSDWLLLEGNAPVDDGRRTFAWRVNRRARYARFKLVSGDAVSKLKLRSLELFVRPSGKS